MGMRDEPSGPVSYLVGYFNRDYGKSALYARKNVVIDASDLPSGITLSWIGGAGNPARVLAIYGNLTMTNVSITGGHNPAAWNALKFVRGDGLYLNATQAEELLDIVHQGEFEKASWDRIRTGVATEDAIGHHLEVLAAAFDVGAARRRGLRVAVDCCNGASTLLSPRWLDMLGCTVLAVNDDPSAPFPHRPEPKPETMAQLKAVVRAGGADLGFAHDADGERIGLVTAEGEALSEERTITLAAAIVLSQEPGTVVTNVSTTRAIDEVAKRHGGTVVRTPVGQSFISEAMIEHRAVIGGEGNGGVAVPRVLMSHDAAAAQGLIIEHMARTGASLAQLVGSLPSFAMVKHDFAEKPSALYSILQDFRDTIEREGISADETDGVVVPFDDGWVHVRASQTESMIRVIAEAGTAARARDLADWARDRLGARG